MATVVRCLGRRAAEVFGFAGYVCVSFRTRYVQTASSASDGGFVHVGMRVSNAYPLRCRISAAIVAIRQSCAGQKRYESVSSRVAAVRRRGEGVWSHVYFGVLVRAARGASPKTGRGSSTTRGQEETKGSSLLWLRCCVAARDCVKNGGC